MTMLCHNVMGNKSMCALSLRSTSQPLLEMCIGTNAQIERKFSAITYK